QGSQGQGSQGQGSQGQGSQGQGAQGQGAQLATNLVSAVNQFGFDGIDIDYPFKLPCSPSLGWFNSVYSDFLSSISSQLRNKTLMITAGQYPINITNLSNIGVDFINIQAFNLNVNSTATSAGIDKIPQILNSWNFIDKSKLILGVEFGGIVEIVSSNNIQSDIENQHFKIATLNSTFPIANEPIPDQYYQSLNAKLDYINSNRLAGISIADITKDSNDSQLMNFIASGTQPTSASVRPSAPSTSPSTSPSSNNTGAIVGGVIGSFIFVGAIAGVGFMLYQKRKVKMSDLLKDTKNQTCSDINRQDYSDINREIRSDTHNRIYSDTNHQSS
ncbi:21859_t:CDS:2, partial [Gigaspora margarita]